MDQLHHLGIVFIQYIQTVFKDQSNLMVWLSHFSNPNWSYIVYFPLSYFLHKSVGKRVLWVAAVSEWLNAVLKWILHGERPYWWVHEAELYQGQTTPHLDQFYISCETGPGSPSGHCMITCSVFYVMVSSLLFHKFDKGPYRIPARFILWSLFLVLTCAINISRCYISSHFPHQVVCGTLVAVLMAVLFNHIPTASLTLSHHLWASVLLFVGAVCTYVVMVTMGLDPHWSISKAQRWCANPDWVHMGTTLFSSLAKASASLIGLGLAVHFTGSSSHRHIHSLKEPPQALNEPLMLRLMGLGLALAFSYLVQNVHISQDPEILFYILSSLKYIVVVFVIAAVIPRLLTTFIPI